MNRLTLAACVLALLTYLPLWKQIRKGEVKQNLLTWVLWATLDGIIATTIFFQKGSFLLPVAYAFGSAMTVFFLMKAGNKTKWTWFEIFVASLVALSMVIWYYSGDRVATMASSLAMVIAGIPQLLDAWKRPQEMPLLAYTGYFFANLISIAAGEDWSVKERFFPVAAWAYTFVAILLTLRRFSARHRARVM